MVAGDPYVYRHLANMCGVMVCPLLHFLGSRRCACIALHAVYSVNGDMAWLTTQAYAQTPIVFLLAVKNNPLQPLIGITYQKLNYLHRASARACILASWVHTVLWVGPLWHNSSMLAFYVLMVCPFSGEL